MRIIALPTKWNEGDGLQPIDVQDIDVIATPAELETLADFFVCAAKTLQESGPADASKEFSDSKPNPQTGIWINVKVTTS